MIRATKLAGRAVVDIDAAEKIGTIDRMILDPEGRRVAGFLISRHRSGFPGSRDHLLLPSSAVHAIGPDAVTVRQKDIVVTEPARLETLPKESELIGRKVVSEDGRFLGKVSDVLIDGNDGRVLGYLLDDHAPGRRLEEMLGKDRGQRERPYLPADAKLRTGRNLVVASEDAVNYEWPGEEEEIDHARTGAPSRWGDRSAAGPGEAEDVRTTGL